MGCSDIPTTSELDSLAPLAVLTKATGFWKVTANACPHVQRTRSATRGSCRTTPRRSASSTRSRRPRRVLPPPPESASRRPRQAPVPLEQTLLSALAQRCAGGGGDCTESWPPGHSAWRSLPAVASFCCSAELRWNSAGTLGAVTTVFIQHVLRSVWQHLQPTLQRHCCWHG